MAQTPEGAKKVAAGRLGVTLAEYEANQAAGLKHCTRCKTWKTVDRFNVDVSRKDGLAAKCRQCSSGGNYPDEMTRNERLKEGWKQRLPTFVPPMKGKKMSTVSRNKMSLARKGKIGIQSGRLGKKHSEATRARISAIAKERTPRGEAHYAFSHGKHQRDKCDRRRAEYRVWRKAVFARDKYACQDCGDNRGGNLQAHHLKSFADNPALRFEVSNGITLCQDCHEKLHLKPIPMPADLRRRRKHIS